jgi:hypothetical protein
MFAVINLLVPWSCRGYDGGTTDLGAAGLVSFI